MRATLPLDPEDSATSAAPVEGNAVVSNSLEGDELLPDEASRALLRWAAETVASLLDCASLSAVTALELELLFKRDEDCSNSDSSLSEEGDCSRDRDGRSDDLRAPTFTGSPEVLVKDCASFLSGSKSPEDRGSRERTECAAASDAGSTNPSFPLAL